MTTKKTYSLRIVAINTRTGVKETLNVDANGHGALSTSGLEHVMTWGARLYGKGWDHVEFSIESVEKNERLPTRVAYRRS